MLSGLNDKKHLSAKDFDVELGKLLKAQNKEWHDSLPKKKAAPKQYPKPKAESKK